MTTEEAWRHFWRSARQAFWPASSISAFRGRRALGGIVCSVGALLCVVMSVLTRSTDPLGAAAIIAVIAAVLVWSVIVDGPRR